MIPKEKSLADGNSSGIEPTVTGTERTLILAHQTVCSAPGGKVNDREEDSRLFFQPPAEKTSHPRDGRSLTLLKTEPRKNVDQTISSSENYTSWYHYRTKNVDKYLQLCPHCKKPTLAAFDRAVIDSAVDYLNGKRKLMSYKKTSRGNFLQSVLIMLAFSTVVYLLASRI